MSYLLENPEDRFACDQAPSHSFILPLKLNHNFVLEFLSPTNNQTTGDDGRSF